MSSTCPPQLQLSIQPNTTSFKRSFEQFGFDLESPVVANSGAATAAAGDGRNERNKRARSASSFESETSSNLSSDTIASTSSSGSNAMSQGDAVENAPTSIENPRLSTPEIEDVEMPDYTEPESVDVQREGPRGSEQYRLALGRFNEFDSEIAVLRQSPSSSTASPPTLPPLRHGVALFRHDETSASPFSSAFFDHVHPVSDSLQQPGSTSDSKHYLPLCLLHRLR
ncbi:hypothetical protein BDN70DRAFT_185474 [Pholiota conissans]|uniref:Uncharacterized protein n=1 Tax=Pholiota conissans TaxID=109636 RepID=A0A9P5YW56_9AGAR|nr:hypothetical protein BDN70DRAFT_185474 [Pholiota conissans]